MSLCIFRNRKEFVRGKVEIVFIVLWSCSSNFYGCLYVITVKEGKKRVLIMFVWKRRNFSERRLWQLTFQFICASICISVNRGTRSSRESESFCLKKARWWRKSLTIDLFFSENRVRMSIVRRGARAVKGLIDVDLAAFIATYMVLYISFMFLYILYISNESNSNLHAFDLVNRKFRYRRNFRYIRIVRFRYWKMTATVRIKTFPIVIRSPFMQLKGR